MVISRIKFIFFDNVFDITRVIVIIMCIIIITASHDKGLSPCDEFCCIVYLNRMHYCHVGFVLHDVMVSVSD